MSNADRLSQLDLIIGLVEEQFGKQNSYEILLERINEEFPQYEFTMDDMTDLFYYSMEVEEIIRMNANSNIYHGEQ